MKRLLRLGFSFALAACGHPPLEAHSIAKPVLLGPVRHLVALDSSAENSPAENSPAENPPTESSPEESAAPDNAASDSGSELGELARSAIRPGGTRPFSFTSIVSTVSYATGPNTTSGSSTRSAAGSFGAAVDYATSGYPDARLDIDVITCVARFSFPLFYANSTERCSVDGSLTLGQPSPDAASRGPRPVGPKD